MLRLNSPGFLHQEKMPEKYVADTCGGNNLSPPLEFLGVPEETRSFVVIAEDPDAPEGTFTHWVAYDIPAERELLVEGASSQADFQQGRNDFGHTGYGGPCPPPGEPHRYFFYLYALDLPSLGLGPGATASQVRDALEGHVLEQAELIGRYGRT